MKKMKGFRAPVALVLAVMMVLGSVAAQAEDHEVDLSQKDVENIYIVNDERGYDYLYHDSQGGEHQNATHMQDGTLIKLGNINNDEDRIAVGVNADEGAAHVSAGNITQSKEETKKEIKTEETTANDQGIIWVEEVKDEAVKNDVTANAFDSFCNELVWKIRNAPQNGTVEADAGDFPGLMQKVFEALNDRPDVSLKLKTRDGEITIPDGAGLLEKVSRGVVTWAEIRGLV